jgi:hypothetical protein
MRTLMLSLLLAVSLLGACGKKKAPASPANTATESAAPAEGATDSNEEKDMAAPEPGDESAGAKSSDPCEGGE